MVTPPETAPTKPEPLLAPLPAEPGARPKKPRRYRSSLTYCLNCGAAVAGRFCPDCGQETHDQSVALGTLASEFAAEVLSFDTKATRTIGALLFRPGFLTNEFTSGRRVRYLSPLKMYLVISTLFFFVLAQQSAIKHAALINFAPGNTATHARTADLSQAEQEIDTSLAHAKTPQDRARLQAAKADLSAVIPSFAPPKPLSPAHHGVRLNVGPRSLDADSLPATVAAYDSRQALLPPHQRDTGAKRFLIRQLVKTQQNKQGLMQGFLDDLPRMMFVLLPAFAFLLKITYWRTKRLYVAHLIFALHTHAFVFLLASGALLLPAAMHAHALGAVLATTAVYLFAALKVVYRQNWGQTLLAFGWLGFNYLFLLTFAFMLTLGVAFLLA